MSQAGQIVSFHRIDGIIVDDIPHIVEDGFSFVDFNSLNDMPAVPVNQVDARINGRMGELTKDLRWTGNPVSPPVGRQDHEVGAVFFCFSCNVTDCRYGGLVDGKVKNARGCFTGIPTGFVVGD